MIKSFHCKDTQALFEGKYPRRFKAIATVAQRKLQQMRTTLARWKICVCRRGIGSRPYEEISKTSEEIKGTVLFILIREPDISFLGYLIHKSEKDKAVLSGTALSLFRNCQRRGNSKIIAAVKFDGFDGGGHKKPVAELMKIKEHNT